jgi:acyl-CoA reductase-like NAD-dependent aldehyde dehydrogenase
MSAAAATSMRTVFERQQAAQRAEPYPDLATRRRRLAALETLVGENLERIAQAINLDFGRRPERETRLLEGFPALAAIRHARHNVAQWMRPRRRAASRWLLPGRTLLLPQPLGVVGIVSPWNYPLLLSVAPLAAALAAGNRAMLKLSEVTPRTAAELAELLAKGFRDDEVAAVQGNAAVGGLCAPALRPSAVHGSRACRPARDARRGRQSDAGHPRTRRQVAHPRGARLSLRPRRGAYRVRQVPERGTDLRRA